MRMLARILAVLMVPLLMAPVGPEDRANPAQKEQIEASAKKVKQLQKERIAALKEAADQLSALHKNGRTSFDEVLETRLLALTAELEAAEKPADRITLYKNIVDVLKEYEQWANARVEAARGIAATALKIKARRLDAEIHLEQASTRDAKEGK
ncbi:hypothetical protein VT84_25995 [Gemmata sp. SH-PL17]|uniref:hypothetical protein n=1 Tax=Gemmata sp. SH-PL17 TaxID=1630693 RepID=UPI00078CED67|nr:hypothetical protein [Gemmata sp. SH-PL17]AMV27882.1 hypothetical protein VT84_25995 [Gemmata sp. SH-PL17]